MPKVNRKRTLMRLGRMIFLGVAWLLLSASAASFAQEAEQTEVSLSADRITQILRREPGLLLEVKRVLVKKAYEQGRLLDPTDLTDNALFQLLRDDEKVRVLATEEIEMREYIRAKPTRQEIEKQRIERVEGTEEAKPGSNSNPGAAENEEEKYWAEHEQPVPRKLSNGQNSEENYYGYSRDGWKDGVDPDLQPTPTAPALQPEPAEPTEPALPPATDAQRRQSLAGVQPPNRDYVTGAPPVGDSLPRVSPQEMPGLLSASMSGEDAANERIGVRGGMAANPYAPMMGGGRNGWNSPQTDSPEFYPASEAGTNYRNPQPGWRMQPPIRAMPEDRMMIRRRANPYAAVPSLYDLYQQISRRAPATARFGEEIFRNGTGNFDELPMDLPVGPDYVLGPGDGLNIELWGGISQHLQRVVDREGRVTLPEAGAVEVNGRSLGDVQQMVQTVLRGEFREVHADVSLARLRTVRIYVVGDVERPGAYDVSSLATPLNALYQAGGPTARGSLRVLRLYRGPKLVAEIDLYDLLLHGVRAGMERLQAGDTVMVPPIGTEVSVQGMVRRPAVYELNQESNLAEALELAGGVLTTGTLRHVEVERVVAHESRIMLRLDVPENNNREEATAALENFKVQDGDKVRISPILPYSERTVYLDGHVVHPGKHAYLEGMRVSDLIASYADLLPEPSANHAEVIRLAPPDFAPQVIAFSLAEALAATVEGEAKHGSDSAQNLVLKPFDTVRVFSRFDFEDPPTITITGEVRHPGEHVTNGETRLRDAVYLAGGVTRNALLADAQVFRRTSDGKLKVISVDLERALAGDAADNLALEPKDRVFIHRNLAKADPPTVRIAGEVAHPGKYPLGEDMTAAELVRLAGGMKRGAFVEAADLTRYTVREGGQMASEHLHVAIGRAMEGEADTDMRLRDGDVLTIGQLAGWNDVGAVITVTGEVMHPGEYGIRAGERLSSVIERAGGMRTDAYSYGAILERRQVRALEEQNRSDLIRQVRGQEASFKMLPDTGDAEDKLAKSATLEQWHATLEQLENLPPTGRLVVHISKDTRRWENTPADLEVRAGDTLFIPKKPNYVVVSGQVYNPTAITYRPGKSAEWYLRQAGGPDNMANRKAIFVVRADGSVVGGKGGEWFAGDALSVGLRPGDTVCVPEKALGGAPVWKNTLQAAQMLSAVAVAVSVGHGF
jgi:protein involved in polysaccharide export with SLBB domain